MSLFQLAPMPSFGIGEEPFATWEGGFTDDELDQIIEYGNEQRFSEATVGSGEGSAPKDLRISKVTWLDNNENTAWIYDRLAHIARQINGQFYRFDLYGFMEDFQFTLYEGDGKDKGHYDWHQDNGPGTTAPRKLSMAMQLNRPDEYEGGDLEILTGNSEIKVKRERGLVAVFPSYQLHRVTPVTKGNRYSLVAWLVGPSFR